MGGFDVGGLLQMLMGGKMGGGGGGGNMGASTPWTAAQPQAMGGGSNMGGPPVATRADVWNAANPQKPSIWSQLGQGLADAQKGGWGYGAMNSLSQPQTGGGARPVGEGAKDKELSSLLMLLNILQSGGMTQGLGKM